MKKKDKKNPKIEKTTKVVYSCKCLDCGAGFRGSSVCPSCGSSNFNKKRV